MKQLLYSLLLFLGGCMTVQAQLDDATPIHYCEPLSDVGQVYCISVAEPVTAGPFIKLSGRDFAGMTLRGLDAYFGQNNIEVEGLVLSSGIGQNNYDKQEFSYVGTLPDMPDDYVERFNLDFTSVDLKMEASRDYLVGYKATFSGRMIANSAGAPFVEGVNYLYLEENPGDYSIDLIEDVYMNVGMATPRNWLLVAYVGASTGATGVVCSDNIQVMPQGDHFDIRGAYDTVSVYNVRGEEVSNEQLASGVYIVRLSLHGAIRSFKLYL